MAGTVEVVQRCFADMGLRDYGLWLNPFWPASSCTLEFSILYRDHLITLSIADHAVRVSSGQGGHLPVRVGCRGRLRELDPGQSLAFSL